MSAARPHILIFNPDQWRGDVLRHMGNPAAVTPVLDGLAASDAVSFRHAFCQNPVCTPSRCSFMTGWYPHTAGHRTMFHMLRRHEPVLLKKLRGAGYFVWWGGKNDLVPGQDGYADFCDVKHRPEIRHRDSHSETDWRGAADGDNYYSFYRGRLEKPADEEHYLDYDWAQVLGAVDFLRRAPRERPLCVYLPLQFPHPPYAVEEPFYSQIDRALMPPRIPAPQDWAGKPSLLRGLARKQRLTQWTEERWTELRATYYGQCARVDHQLGLVVQALREAGMYDDTALFVFSDHGDFTGDYGLVEKTQNTFEDCLTRVPLVVKPPAHTAVRPRVSDALVELIDFTATVYDLAGVSPGYWHFGRSLMPLLSGRTDEHRDAVFCEGGRLRDEDHCAERESQSHDNPAGLYYPRMVLQQSLPEHTKAAMCRTRNYKYVRRLYEEDELYDLRADPQELHNRIADPALADVRERLRARLLTWYMETCDTVPFEPDKRT